MEKVKNAGVDTCGGKSSTSGSLVHRSQDLKLRDSILAAESTTHETTSYSCEARQVQCYHCFCKCHAWPVYWYPSRYELARYPSLSRTNSLPVIILFVVIYSIVGHGHLRQAAAVYYYIFVRLLCRLGPRPCQACRDIVFICSIDFRRDVSLVRASDYFVCGRAANTRQRH